MTRRGLWSGLTCGRGEEGWDVGGKFRSPVYFSWALSSGISHFLSLSLSILIWERGRYPIFLPVCEIGVDIEDPLIVAASGSGLKPGAVGLRRLLADSHLLLDNAGSQAFSLQKGN